MLSFGASGAGRLFGSGLMGIFGCGVALVLAPSGAERTILRADPGVGNGGIATALGGDLFGHPGQLLPAVPAGTLFPLGSVIAGHADVMRVGDPVDSCEASGFYHPTLSPPG